MSYALRLLWAAQESSCEQVQYTAVLELRAGGDVLDALRVRFGVQSLTQQADTWRQNGRRLFLFGYVK